MEVSFSEREKISGMVNQLMVDYEKEIEAAYLATEGVFKIALSAKIESQGNTKVITVEMSFDPAKKIKDRITETIDLDQMKLPFKDKQDLEPAG
ncbi:MAG: hypothetical protein JRJ39_00385 [Deltaproteobacteria bacterium]|nr:hypothetical protein [Deltaproteobacteria bacterium]MBW1845565.1 hypothetical protein [Deltaproteobacteria bacterium]MBW2031995.1 hypothetical protein [Deltaproteobacteria bacterium]